jgi:pimeloyl-ACP methyl ester carboxylesterase
MTPDAEFGPVFHGRRMAINGLELNVVIEGRGPDVLLVHGFPDSHKVWRRQIGVLAAAGYRVIAPDLRGFGDSEAPTARGAYRVQHFVDDLVALLDALGVAQAMVVGHDWGAVCGWFLALRHPLRVARYVAMSVGHPEAYPRGGLAQKLKGYYVPICASPLGVPWLKFANWNMFRLVANYPPEFALWRADMARPGRLRAGLNIYRDNLNLVLARRYGQVAVPVLGMWSSADHALARRQMVISGDYVDGPWRYEEVAGAGPWLPLDAPDAINTLLLDYLRQPIAALH